MIQIKLKQGENIDKALKRFKRKFEQVGVVKEMRSRMAFEKPSTRKRAQKKKAIYIQSKRQE